MQSHMHTSRQLLNAVTTTTTTTCLLCVSVKNADKLCLNVSVVSATISTDLSDCMCAGVLS